MTSAPCGSTPAPPRVTGPGRPRPRFTLGNNVVFGAASTLPELFRRHLLAHELTHVVQQTPLVARRAPIVQRRPGIGPRQRGQPGAGDRERAGTRIGSGRTRHRGRHPGSELVFDADRGGRHGGRPGADDQNGSSCALRPRSAPPPTPAWRDRALVRGLSLHRFLVQLLQQSADADERDLTRFVGEGPAPNPPRATSP